MWRERQLVTQHPPLFKSTHSLSLSPSAAAVAAAAAPPHLDCQIRQLTPRETPVHSLTSPVIPLSLTQTHSHTRGGEREQALTLSTAQRSSPDNQPPTGTRIHSPFSLCRSFSAPACVTRVPGVHSSTTVSLISSPDLSPASDQRSKRGRRSSRPGSLLSLQGTTDSSYQRAIEQL